MRRIRMIIFVLGAVTCNYTMASDGRIDYPIEIVDPWQTVLNQDGVLIEYKVQECNNLNVKNQVLVLFRFTNESSAMKTLHWSVKEFRNGDCTNCDRLEAQEFIHSMTMSPGQVIEGDGTSKMDKRIYLFSHFIELVPGMTNQTLTDFEFVNLNVQTLQTDGNDK